MEPAPSTLRKTIRVGVTGHRDLPPEGREELRRVVRAVLARVRTAVDACDPLPSCPWIFGGDVLATLITPLAAGADQLVAEEALEAGYEIQAPLPFPRDEYRRDFDGDSDAAARFDTLIDRTTALLELDGARADAGAAYEAVGRVMMEHSDLLVAVWEETKPGGVGGTGQIVEEALASRIPVVVIPPSRPAGAFLLARERSGQDRRRGLDELEPWILDVLFPGRETNTVSDAGGALHLRRQRKEYAAFCAEKTMGRRWSRRLLIGRIWASLWSLFLAPFHQEVWREPASVPLPGETGEKRGGIDRHRAFLETHYTRASRAAMHYAGLYRSSFLMNYLLGASAVTLVLLANFVPTRERLFLSLELLCIATILSVNRIGRLRRWHQKAVDYRILAELFRQMRYLGPLATSIPFTRPPAHARKQGDLTGTWMNWHFRSVLRQAGMVSASFTASYRAACREMVRKEWIAPQKEYHREAHGTQNRARVYLEWGGAFLFLGTLAACMLHLTAHPIAHALHADLPGYLLPLLTILAASLPAWGAAFHGIESQGEFERLTERSESMEHRLDEFLASFDGAGDEKAPSREELARRAREVAEEMMQEVIDWRVLYRAHGIPTA